MCRRGGRKLTAGPAREGANVVGEVVGSIRVVLAGHQTSDAILRPVPHIWPCDSDAGG
jgi:hypothetical protein